MASVAALGAFNDRSSTTAPPASGSRRFWVSKPIERRWLFYRSPVWLGCKSLAFTLFRKIDDDDIDVFKRVDTASIS